ncbi:MULTISPECIES: hypothetical protein [Clostridium]|uniref:Uncharacterized protein n=1 Tax=Clostridium frigoriphilum TaxID=443253 RepID=A0ABU7UV63_9CLOT|nr:hypothetical protein [Clostridium sp. DSM 17811]MBU3102449.1 hypothetical protein [Clostridium sp. DSM 17811]
MDSFNFEPTRSVNIDMREQKERMKRITDQMDERNREKNNRDIENNENLKQIVQYNKLLTELNEKMLGKMSSANGTLSDVLNSVGGNSQRLEVVGIQQNEKLDELKAILESNAPDKSNKILSYFSGLSGTLGVEMLATYIKIKLGVNS